METWAVIKTGGKQYLVTQGETIKVEKLNTPESGELSFEVLAVKHDNKLELGTPLVAKAKVTRVKSKFGIVGDHVVGWGTSKRKNYDRSIEAFNKVKQKLGLTTFVLLGNTSYNKDDVIKTGFVTNEEVSAIYSGAQALLYPSLDEGFGISILDAFVCGCPVVTSNRSSMPEAAGNAAILVDPYSTDAIAVGLSRAIKNANLLNKKAKVQLKKFSWEETARKTLKIYEKAAKR